MDKSIFTPRRTITRNIIDRLSAVEETYMDDPANLKPISLSDKRVLVIGDLHAPFVNDRYLPFCKEMYEIWNCDTVVFIGDIVDNHYASFHETDPNGLSGVGELDLAIQKLAEYYKAFPEAYVTIGNHDRMIMRKAYSSNIPRQWIREYKSVLETPNWTYLEQVEIDGVLYIHGEGGTARGKIKSDFQSVVQGHLHSQAYIEFFQGNTKNLFAMQVGCGVDGHSYAMAYGKHFRKSILSCGVVVNGRPYLECMV